MAEEKSILGKMRDKAGELSGTAREIANLNQEEAQNFENSDFLEEIKEDEEKIEHFDRNVEELEEEVDEIIHKRHEFDEKAKEKIWNDVMTISEEARQLSERYTHLPEQFTQAAIANEDGETASIAHKYYLRIEHVLELAEIICDAEAEETVTDEFRDVKRPTKKLRKEKKKLQDKRKDIERKRRKAKKKFQRKGLIN